MLRARGKVAEARHRVRRRQLELPLAGWLVVLNRCRFTEVLRAGEDALEQLLGLLGQVLAVRERPLRVDRLDPRDDQDDRVRVDPHVRENVDGVPDFVVLSQLHARDGGPHDRDEVVPRVGPVLEMVLRHMRTVVHVELVHGHQ